MINAIKKIGEFVIEKDVNNIQNEQWEVTC